MILVFSTPTTREFLQNTEFMATILFVSMFLTVFLIVFFLFNLRKDTLKQDIRVNTISPHNGAAPYPVLNSQSKPSLLMKAAAVDTVIKEREGVPYVNDNVLNRESNASKTIDRDFKELVDSVLN